MNAFHVDEGEAMRRPLAVGDVVRSAKGDFRVARLYGGYPRLVVHGNRKEGGKWGEAVQEVTGYWVQVERADA